MRVKANGIAVVLITSLLLTGFFAFSTSVHAESKFKETGHSGLNPQGDRSEIGLFSKTRKNVYNVHGTEETARLYAEMNNWQLNRGKDLLDFLIKRGYLKKLKEQDLTIDMGCGTGELTSIIASLVNPAKVIAIDPDPKRIEYARSSIPPSITNLKYYRGKAEDLRSITDDSGKDCSIKDHSTRAIIMNYVAHWVRPEGKVQMLQEAARCLEGEGFLAIECVAPLMPFLEEVSLLAGGPGRELVGAFYCPTKDEWGNLLKETGMVADYIAYKKLPFEFPNLEGEDGFFPWWEGTTNRKFNRENIPAPAMKKLKEQYPGKVSFGGTAIRLVAHPQDVSP